MKPRLVILDEAVSALDKSVETQVLQLPESQADSRADLRVHQPRSTRGSLAVGSDPRHVPGEVVEIGPAEQLFTASALPELFSSMPSMDPENRTLTSPLSGDPPNPIAPPSAPPHPLPMRGGLRR